MIDRNSCGYVPRNELTKKGKENERANRIEWEHIMPVPFIFSKYGQEKSPNLYIVNS
jgi:deoxyribonuclease-1